MMNSEVKRKYTKRKSKETVTDFSLAAQLRAQKVMRDNQVKKAEKKADAS
jgi:hypothetical protein